MEIIKYELIDKITNKTKPFYDRKRGFFVFKVEPRYKYFCQARQLNAQTGDYDYFLLLSATKFNDSCKKCYIDDIGRYKISPTKELKDFLILNSVDDENFEVIYVESNECYDVWQIN